MESPTVGRNVRSTLGRGTEKNGRRTHPPAVFLLRGSVYRRLPVVFAMHAPPGRDRMVVPGNRSSCGTLQPGVVPDVVA